MKLVWRGNLFNPTGIATAYRELVKQLIKKDIKIQSSDLWHDSFEFNNGLEDLNKPINVRDAKFTIFADYPHMWRDAYGTPVACFLHEGTKLPEGWVQLLNTVQKVIVPSNATKNLFRINGVQSSIYVVPFGTNQDLYKPVKKKKEEEYIFLSVNSWTGLPNDRKGTDVIIKAFDEEFKKEEKVKLVLKISSFWQKQPVEFYIKGIYDILGHTNANILVNAEYVPEEKLAEHYQKADCFLMPTRGEAFGLTAINAMASGLPLIITRDNNSGHMDFCRGKDSVLFIETKGMEQADRRFFVEGNLQPIPDVESLRKQMRFAFENQKELKEKALKTSDIIRKDWTWEKSADKFIEVLNENTDNR